MDRELMLLFRQVADLPAADRDRYFAVSVRPS